MRRLVPMLDPVDIEREARTFLGKRRRSRYPVRPDGVGNELDFLVADGDTGGEVVWAWELDSDRLVLA